MVTLETLSVPLWTHEISIQHEMQTNNEKWEKERRRENFSIKNVDVMNKISDRWNIFMCDAISSSGSSVTSGCHARLLEWDKIGCWWVCLNVSGGDMTGDFHLICKTFQVNTTRLEFIQIYLDPWVEFIVCQMKSISNSSWFIARYERTNVFHRIRKYFSLFHQLRDDIDDEETRRCDWKLLFETKSSLRCSSTSCELRLNENEKIFPQFSFSSIDRRDKLLLLRLMIMPETLMTFSYLLNNYDDEEPNESFRLENSKQCSQIFLWRFLQTQMENDKSQIWKHPPGWLQ